MFVHLAVLTAFSVCAAVRTEVVDLRVAVVLQAEGDRGSQHTDVALGGGGGGC